MLTKETLKKHIESLPNEFSIDELIDKLVFIEKLEKRIEESNQDKVISNDQIKDQLKEWSK